MKNARAKRAKILFFIVKYANLWGFRCRRRRGCLSSLFSHDASERKNKRKNKEKEKSLILMVVVCLQIIAAVSLATFVASLMVLIKESSFQERGSFPRRNKCSYACDFACTANLMKVGDFVDLVDLVTRLNHRLQLGGAQDTSARIPHCCGCMKQISRAEVCRYLARRRYEIVGK